MEREKFVGVVESGDCNQIKTLVVGQDANVADEAGQLPAPVDQVRNALKILVRNAIEEFGFIPRDVYNGVLDLPRTRERHHRAVRRLDYSKLESLVGTLIADCVLDQFSRHVVVMFPSDESLPGYVRWGVDFKSIRIARTAVESMQLKENKRLQKIYNSVHWFGSAASTLAGWIFQAMAHRILSSASTPKPVPMVTNEGNPPAFSTPTDPPSVASSTLDPSPSSFGQSQTGTRVVTRIDFTRELGNVTLDCDRYYIPTVAAHPLFDSFAIDLGQRTVTISVFRMAIPPRHGRSAEGYPFIREIIAHVRRLLENAGSDAKVKVTCLLVCPDDKSQYQWWAPADWDTIIKTNNHDGRAFCIRLPGAFRPSQC